MIFTEIKASNLYSSILGNTPKAEADALVKVGGESLSKFVPNINASKWNDECWLNINNRAVEVTRSMAQTFVDGKVDLIVGNDCHRYYIDANGHMNYDIIYSSMPKPEILLDLQFSSGLEFLYQPPLTADEINEGCIRAENVCGSYAIYWNRAHNQYQSGKFCHIARPRFIDAKGNCIWVELFIDPSANIVSIRCDEGWLRDASYPVTLDPDFGYKTVGGSSIDTGEGYIRAIAKGTPASSGTTTYFNIYTTITNTGRYIKYGLYTDSTGPSALVSGSPIAAGPLSTQAEGWLQLPCSGLSVTGSSAYWITTDLSAYIKYFYDSETGSHKYDSHVYANAWLNPFETESVLNRKHTVYMDYTAAASGLSIPIILNYYNNLLSGGQR